MSLFANTAQTLIFDTLDGVISCNVYDDVPDQTSGNPAENMPYVVIGSDQAFPFETDSFVGENITVELVFWSAYSGKKEVKGLMAEAHALLHRQTLTIAGADVVDCLHTFSSIFAMGANNYVQAVSRYRLTLKETS